MAHMTKRLLADGLKELLKKKTLDHITVKELVQHCGVNRQTFYYNFQDIFELLEWIFTTEGNRFLEETSGMENWQERVLAVFSELSTDDNRRLILNAMYSVNHMQLDRFLKNYFRPLIEEIVDKEIEGMKLSEDDRDFLIRLYVVLCIDIVMRWVNEGMDSTDNSGDLERLIKAMSGSAKMVAEKLID